MRGFPYVNVDLTPARANRLRPLELNQNVRLSEIEAVFGRLQNQDASSKNISVRLLRTCTLYKYV